MIQNKDNIRDWVIYKITSPSGRVYVGRTSNFKSRMQDYKKKNPKLSQPLIGRSLKKYGFSNHEVVILEKFKGDNEYSSGKEMFWIRSFMSQFHKYPEQRGMNLTMGGEGTIGIFVSEEQKRKSSETRKANLTDEERTRLRNMSYVNNGLPSPRLGKTHTDEVKAKLSAFHTGKKWNLGKVRTPEMKEKYRQSSMGKSLGRKYTGEKLERIRKSGLSKRKPILQYDLNHNFIAEHISISQAVKDTHIPQTTIHHILNGRIPKPKKFIFKYK